jgi:hypothetical protein
MSTPIGRADRVVPSAAAAMMSAQCDLVLASTPLHSLAILNVLL